MNFLSANKILKDFKGGEALPFLLAMSGTSEPLLLYLRASAALAAREAKIRTLPYGTLHQTLLSPATDDEREVFILFPWDLAAACDWRSGIPLEYKDLHEILKQAAVVAGQLGDRPFARIIYITAPICPLFPDPADTAILEAALTGLAADLGAHILPASAFSMASLLASGCPVGGSSLGSVAETVMQLLLGNIEGSAKILVTDLDYVMWDGMVAEDGADGISFGPEGKGYKHFLYQSLLRRLQGYGVSLAAVSRNDADMALGPFRQGNMVLGEDDFVAVLASYNAKSAQIAQLATILNLGLEAFVFVDDNPVELAEVAAQLPLVQCIQFPAQDEDIPPFFHDLASRFKRTEITGEDRKRTEMYRTRLAGIAPSDARGADLESFLRDLGMTLTLLDRTRGDHTRLIQLINKTNQFNLNGKRWTKEEIDAALEGGGRLLGAALTDQHGDHGEIIGCLISGSGVIEALVMSCRVFQRRVEHAFLAWLGGLGNLAPLEMRYRITERNMPCRRFLAEQGLDSSVDGRLPFAALALHKDPAHTLDLFQVIQT